MKSFWQEYFEVTQAFCETDAAFYDETLNRVKVELKDIIDLMKKSSGNYDFSFAIIGVTKIEGITEHVFAIKYDTSLILIVATRTCKDNEPFEGSHQVLWSAPDCKRINSEEIPF